MKEKNLNEIELKLKEADEFLYSENTIPKDILPIIVAICHGYITETCGKLSLSGIKNICKTKFNKINEDNENFRNEDKRFAETQTEYTKDCEVEHTINYLDTSNTVKLIAILTHEIGHVITEYEPLEYINGIYPYAKRTATYYTDLAYKEDKLFCRSCNGFRVADGFLESTSKKIWEQDTFRKELLSAGYDLEDYSYKDKRLFESRSYDEYATEFELMDYIMNGALSEFSIKKFESNEEMQKYIKDKKINVIYPYLDKANDANAKLKEYEKKDVPDEVIENYIKGKKAITEVLAPVLAGEKENDSRYAKLLSNYISVTESQCNLIPRLKKHIPKEWKKESEEMSI